MENLLKRTWAEINLDALEKNVRVIQKRAGSDKALMAIVKADAYGHGDHIIAGELNRLGVTFFGVSNIEEALSLRKSGVTGEILILGATPAEFAGVLAEYNITQALFCFEYAKQLSAAAQQAGVAVKIHFKIDTGMGRIGFDCQDGGHACTEIFEAAELPGIQTEGIFSHFSVADALDAASEAYTMAQQNYFEKTVSTLQNMGLRFRYIHLQNSAGIIRHPDRVSNMVRMGISMYGLTPSEELSGQLPVSPLMELKTTVAMVKEIPAGRSVSYGRAFVSERPMRVATVPVGYADGYRRALSGKGRMLLHGQSAPVLGKVCMDQLMLDVSSIPESKAGDTVTVFGRCGESFLPVEELASWSDTINYEIICGISRRVPRVYLKGGRIVKTVDYLLP